jgi:L,D-peptidoglycan transpeptidase YkuD (ErfK/YbiS/YcfS/YnhG family)
MIYRARADGHIQLNGSDVRCALGKAGVIAAADKREGDNKSPVGAWMIREVLYRPDVYPDGPKTALPVKAMAPDDGWCDAPGDPAYNRPVKLPYPASAERMWRDDAVYDLVGILAHNDDPPVPGLGSAIFLHLARDGYPGTEGCVALGREDLEALLAVAEPGDAIEIGAN